MPNSPIIVTPVGRIIGGSTSEIDKTDHLNRPLPENKWSYSFGLAVRKDDPRIGEVLQQIAAHAHAEFGQAPNVQALIGQYNFAPNSGFSWKIKDGDLPNSKGQLNDNSKGCYVFWFSSTFPLKCCDQNNAEIPAGSIERGFFADVAFTAAGNGNTDNTAGVYLNPQVTRLVAFGEKIIGGVDAETAFAGHALPAQLPPGASLTPVAGAMAMPPAGVPVSPVAGQQPMQPVSPQVMPTAQQSTPPMTGSPGSVVPPTGVPAGVTPHQTFANVPPAAVTPAVSVAPAGAPPGIPVAPGVTTQAPG